VFPLTTENYRKTEVKTFQYGYYYACDCVIFFIIAVFGIYQPLLYIAGLFYFIFRFSGYLIVISSHYKNEFDSRGQLFSRFLSHIQFAISLSFLVLSIKSLFVENWDYFLLNSGLMILSMLAGLRGLSSFKLKDYMDMRTNFFQTQGLLEHDINFDNEDQIFCHGNTQPYLQDYTTENVRLQRSVIKKFHNLYTDSVIKEVILRSQIQYRNQMEISSRSKHHNSELHSNHSKKIYEDIASKIRKRKTSEQDSLAKIISDKNVNKLSKHYMNTCGLDISYGSVEPFEQEPFQTKNLINNLIEIHSD
jgi:hypothetical protein